MCLLGIICSPAGSLLLCAGLASAEHRSKPSLKTLRKIFPWILPPFLTFPLPDNTESGKHSTYKSRLWCSIPGILSDSLPPHGIWGCFQAALLSHTQLASGGLFIVTGSSTNIHDLVPQIFVSHESREPLHFTRVVTSQTKAINKVWNLQYPPRGMEKGISAGRKDQVLLQWQMVLHKRSTLGSFCCSLFINNLSDIGITARVQRYADNKMLFYSPRSPAGTAKSLQSDFSVAGHFWGCLCQESTASLWSEDEMEKFHGSRAWPLTYPEFSAPLPTSHSFHSSPERESAQPQPCSRVGKPPPTPGEFCAPQQESPLHCSKIHAIGFFQFQVWALRKISSNNSHNTATNCPAQVNPERSHWQNKGHFHWSEPSTASEEWSA